LLSETEIDSSSSSGENREGKQGKIKLEIHSDKIFPNEVLCTRQNQNKIICPIKSCNLNLLPEI
jgi:hypothetical protein